ncbi:MAG: hypothetical protein LC659_09495 [Myxococcales bacterium]|nr:hypothetical protein [Myxococcales bacterium]
MADALDNKRRNRVTFPALAAADFEHPGDVVGTEALRSVPGLDSVGLRAKALDAWHSARDRELAAPHGRLRPAQP